MALNCATPPLERTAIGDELGTYPLFITGSDDSGVIDGSGLAADYVPSVVGNDGTFVIFIEVAAPIAVQLADGTDYTISTVQATANLGKMFPAKIKKVYKTGTTGDFSTAY
jgi:hypothetical protein